MISVAKFHEMALLGMLAAGYFALAGSLDVPTALLTLGALAVRGAMLAGWIQGVVPAKLGTALGLAALAFYPLDQKFLSQSFLTSTVHLVCFLAVIKILTATTRRDFAWVRVIALLELLAASLLSFSPTFFVFLGLFLLCGIAAFSSGEVVRAMTPSPDLDVVRSSVRLVPRRLALFSTALFTGILVLTAGMFFVLPRTARAALQRFVPQRYHLPGFSNEISLGELGEIKQRNTPAMHVRSLQGVGPVPMQRWRGASLGQFDGLRWFNPPGPDEYIRVGREGAVTLPGRSLRVGRSMTYQVQLSEIASDTLFFAGNPQTVTINLPLLRRSPGGAFRIPRTSVTGLRYNVFAVMEDERAPQVAPEPLSEPERREMLALPAIDTRIPQLAREYASGAATPELRARAIEGHLRNDFSYTLELPSEQHADPLAYFLFERRKGHCEYFASAMTVMLRSQGIPARIATGFLGGTYNPMTGWQVIRASDAHSWVEAWIDGRGWTTFDPTPSDPNAAAPSRLLSNLALLADAAGQFWQDWVLSYDLERQIVLASRIEESGRRMRFDWFEGASKGFDAGADWAKAWLPWLIAAGVLIAGVVFYGRDVLSWLRRVTRMRRVRRGQVHASDATLLYARMLQVLERRGYRKPAWITPREFAETLPPSELRTLVADLTEAYTACRFGGRMDVVPQVAGLLSQIERAGSVRA